MGSSFSGLNIVVRSLFAQQRAIEVTGHNIANVNTDGYSRQRAVFEAAMPQPVSGGKGMLGSGVDVQYIERIRNSFLDVKFRGENTSLGEWEARSSVLEEIEIVFNEPSDSGLNTVIDQFFGALQELTKDAGSLTTRALLKETAVTLTNTLNRMADQFNKVQEDVNFAIETSVKAINSYAEQISKLNRQIMAYEVDGSNANDLRDQRDLLLDKLSKIADIRTFEDSGGRLRVSIGGRLLVNHGTVNRLVLVKRGETYYGANPPVTPPVKNPDVDAEGLYQVMWDDGMSFTPGGGELKGLMDMLDGNGLSGTACGIPFYMRELNRFASEFAQAINDIHKQAYNLVDDGYTQPGGHQVLFFTDDITASSYTEVGGIRTAVTPAITAANITISKEIYEDINAIAVAAELDTLPSDATLGLEMVKLRNKNIFPEYGTLEDFIKSMVSTLGVDGQEAIRLADGQRLLTDQTNTLRMSTSGVSIDEEMANMIRFQHSYNAAARMITAIDEMIDVVVNRMGIVGR